MFRGFTVVAVIALAISTWILSSPTRRPRTTPAEHAADLPGYYLRNAVLVDYDPAGNPSIRLEADRMDQIAHSTEVALTNVRMSYQTTNGQNWLLVGDLGHVQHGGSIIDVTGNVKLQGDSTEHAGTAIVRTDALSYDVVNSIATTAGDVRIDFGPQSLSARGLTANLKERTMHLEQKVNGRFQR